MDISNESRERYRPFRRNLAFQYALQVARYLFPFITLPYLTRVLGPDEYSVRAYVLAAMSFMQVFLDYGFNSYGAKVVAENRESRYRIRIETTCISLLRAQLCIVGAVMLAAIVPLISIVAENWVYVVIAYVGVCFKATMPDFIFQGLEDMGIITKRFVLSQSVAVILILTLVRGPQSLLLIPVFEGLASFIAFVWSWANIMRTRRISYIRVRRSQLWATFKSSTVFFLAQASTTVFSTVTTLVIGALIVDRAQVAYWSIATTAVAAVQSLYTPITYSLYPHMVRRRDFHLLKKFLSFGLVVVTIGTLLFAALSEFIMRVLGGTEYLAGAPILVMIAPVLWFSYPAMLFGFPVLAAVGWVRQLTVSAVAGATFQLVGLLALAFGGWFSIESVAVLRCCTEAVLCFGRAAFVAQYLRGVTEK